jgi:hypothetical protein
MAATRTPAPDVFRPTVPRPAADMLGIDGAGSVKALLDPWTMALATRRDAAGSKESC